MLFCAVSGGQMSHPADRRKTESPWAERESQPVLVTEVLFSHRSSLLPHRIRFVLWFLLAFRSRRLRRPQRLTAPAATAATHTSRATSHPRYNPLLWCLAQLLAHRLP